MVVCVARHVVSYPRPFRLVVVVIVEIVITHQSVIPNKRARQTGQSSPKHPQAGRPHSRYPAQVLRGSLRQKWPLPASPAVSARAAAAAPAAPVRPPRVVSRVRVLCLVVATPAFRAHPVGRGVPAAGVAHQDCSPLNAVAWAAVGHATIDGVLVVEAAACRVQLDQLEAHGDDEL